MGSEGPPPSTKSVNLKEYVSARFDIHEKKIFRKFGIFHFFSHFHICDALIQKGAFGNKGFENKN